MTGLSFLVTSGDTREDLYFNELSFSYQYTPADLLSEIKKEIDSQILLQSCTEIILVYANTTYTLVPESLFDETKLSEYLKFNSKILIGDYITHDPLEQQELHIIYVPYVNINNYFFETFGSFQYYHAASILLESVQKTGTKVYIHLQQDHFDLIIFKNGNLALCNSYPFKTPEDLIYYVLFALEQTQLNPDNVETVLLGKIDESDKNFEILYTYIRNISTGNASDEPPLNDSTINQQYLLKNIP